MCIRDRHYKELLAVSPMEIFYCGSRPGKEVAAMLREAFALLPRGEIDLDLGTDIRMNAVEEKPRYFTEEDEISQGVLAVGFRLGECMDCLLYTSRQSGRRAHRLRRGLCRARRARSCEAGGRDRRGDGFSRALR